MSPRRARRINRQAAERLLRGEPVGGSGSLRELLVAATAPPRAGELSGEQAAMAAFRAAHLAHAHPQRRRSVIKSTVLTLLTAKVLVPAAAVAAAGGIAVAAATGNLPAPGGHPPSPPPPTSQPQNPGPQTPASAVPNHATPSPSLAGLCQGYQAGAGAEHGKALDSPAFTALITAAGGKDHVAEYCATLRGDKTAILTPATPPSGAPQTRPTGPPQTPNPAHPTSRPTEVPHPTGPPATPPAH
jgi:hypothetical protein